MRNLSLLNTQNDWIIQEWFLLDLCCFLINLLIQLFQWTFYLGFLVDNFVILLINLNKVLASLNNNIYKMRLNNECLNDIWIFHLLLNIFLLKILSFLLSEYILDISYLSLILSNFCKCLGYRLCENKIDLLNFHYYLFRWFLLYFGKFLIISMEIQDIEHYH